MEQGWADQNDVARAFGCSVRTVRRHQRRFEDGGLSTLGHGKGYPKGRRRLRHSRSNLIRRLKSDGHSTREIARRISVDEKAVRKLLRRMGCKQMPPAQPFPHPFRNRLPRVSVTLAVQCQVWGVRKKRSISSPPMSGVLESARSWLALLGLLFSAEGRDVKLLSRWEWE